MFWDQIYKLSIWGASLLIIIVSGIMGLQIIRNASVMPSVIEEALQAVNMHLDTIDQAEDLINQLFPSIK